MKKKEIQNLYKEKLKILINHNKNYYEKNKPSIDDQKYDELKKEILSLENDYKFLNSKNSPSVVVGYKPSKNFKKSFHRVPMLSLGNAFSEEDLKNFQKKITNYLS